MEPSVKAPNAPPHGKVALGMLLTAAIALAGCPNDGGSDTPKPDDAGATTTDAATDSEAGGERDPDANPDTQTKDVTDADQPDDTGDAAGNDAGGIPDEVADIDAFLETFDDVTHRVACRFERHCTAWVSTESDPIVGEAWCERGTITHPGIETRFEFPYKVRRAVEKGLRNYDPDAAQQCLASLRNEGDDDSPCDYDDSMAEACEDVVTPAQGEGDRCLRTPDCDEGLYCKVTGDSDYCHGTCQPLEAGAPCDLPDGIEEPLRRECPDDLVCAERESGKPECVEPTPVGDRCDRSEPCAESDICYADSEGETCRARVEEGGDCFDDLTGIPIDRWCEPSTSCFWESEETATCKPPVETGESCDTTPDCKNPVEATAQRYEQGENLCTSLAGSDGEQCVTPPLEEGDSCFSAAFYCGSGLACVDGKCREFERKEAGESCNAQMAFCDAGLACTAGSAAGDELVCREFGDEGDICSPDAPIAFPYNDTCGPGLTCHLGAVDADEVGKCRPFVEKGETCNDAKGLDCKDGLKCQADQCVEKEIWDVGENCVDSHRADGTCRADTECRAPYPDAADTSDAVCGGRYAACPMD